MNAETRASGHNFPSGLHLTDIQFIGSRVAFSHDRREDFGCLPLPEDDPKLMSQVAEQLNQPFVVQSLGGHAVEAVMVGEGPTLLSVRGDWESSDIRSTATQRQIQELAAATKDSGTTIMYSNPPGVGRTSRLPRSLWVEMAKTGNMEPHGLNLSEALGHVACQFDNVVLAGHSLGAFEAAAMAATLPGTHGIEAESLRIIDPLSSETSTYREIIQDFLAPQGGYFDRAPGIASVARRRGFNDRLGRAIVTKNGGMEHSLLSAAPHVRREILVISPELSRHGGVETMADILDRVSAATNPDTGVWQRIIRGYSHAEPRAWHTGVGNTYDPAPSHRTRVS